MIAIVSLLTVVTVSIIITRIATVALMHTGVSREMARFQSRSAFTGVGFTTGEAERIVQHPVRRRIVMGLMLLGNAGIVTAVSSLILTFVADEGAALGPRIVLLVAGIVALYALASSRWVDRRLSRLIDWALARYTDLEVRDYASLMQLVGDYRLVELHVEPEDWLCDKSLAELELRDEGVVVLGVHRADGDYVGAPNGDTVVLAGDTLLLYGRTAGIASLDERRRGPSGDREHDRAVAEQEAAESEELRREEEPEQGEAESSKT